MDNPQFIIREADKTGGGSLRVRSLEMISRLLLDGGYVLLPSDTAFAVAALAVTTDTQASINRMLNRPNWPLSLAFPSVRAVREWVSSNVAVDGLLERFCPGPITVVCRAAPGLPASFFDKAISSKNRTIGVRIPDSVIEREVAGCTGFPITTVAVREPGGGTAITSLDRAREIVAEGVKALGGAAWCAIEGRMVYAEHSTVVQVGDNGVLTLLREGSVPFDEIAQAVKDLPVRVLRDPA